MEFNSTGAMKSPFSPRVRQSIAGRRPIGLASAKKNQSNFMHTSEQTAGDVIYKTSTITLETYGSPLPVMVTETLTFASGDVSVRMGACGWFWVVAGRKVLAWPREASTPSPTARELTLPQTDLAHKADLVMLFYEEDAQMPSCIGVSPEGVVRYWSSVGTEGAYSDTSCELAGQECDRLTESKDGLLLATTTCTLVKITTNKEGRPSVVCQTMRPPSGWLGGIGRRVSLLFFGSMPAHADTKLVGVVVLPPRPNNSEGVESEEEECIALVAGGPMLQLWCGQEVHEHHLRRPLSEAFARAHLAPQGDLNSLEVACLDVHAHARGLLLLVAAANVARSPDTRYALAHVSVEQPAAVRVVSLCALRVPRDDEPPRCVPLHSHVLLYAPSYAYLAAVAPGAGEAGEYVELGGAGDALLGAAAPPPLLFTRRHGALLLRRAEPLPQAPSLCDSPMGSPCPSDMYEGNLSLYEIDPHEVSATSTDAVGKLKSAFLFHVRGDAAAAARVVAELFPRDPPDALDATVLALAHDMLDDAPVGDPRWKLRSGSARAALGASSALQCGAQLRDKQRALSLLLDFLRAQRLWRRLAGARGEHTAWALCALAERLAAARALQRLHRAGAPLIDAALHQVTAAAEHEAPDSEDGEEPEVLSALRSGALSSADVCFRRVTRILRVLRAVAALPPPPHDARAAAMHALSALSVLTTTVGEMQACRAQWQCSAPRAPPALGPRSVLSALSHAHTRALTQCVRACEDMSLRAQLVEAAGTLADLLLSEAEPLAQHSNTEHLYEKLRRETIQPYVDEGQVERAAVLAEKFKDFELLVELCVRRGDLDRLYGYLDKYKDEGIAEKTFAWLHSRDGPSRALLLRVLAAQQQRADAWLAAVPARAPIQALQLLSRGRLAHAASLYAQLADEAPALQATTTLASISKLCLLASDLSDVEQSDTWRRVEGKLSLAELQQALPRELLLHHGLDDSCRLLDPEELVQIYLDADSKILTDYDFKRALDITEFVQDMERRDELRLKVWCACVRSQDWRACDAEHASDSRLCRLVDLVHVTGGDLELLLPPLDDILTAPELAELVSDPRVHYLIKYSYECVDNMRAGDVEA